MMRFLLTGSGGFVSGAVADAALRAGHSVLGLSRSSQPPQGWRAGHLQVDVAVSDLTGIIKDFSPDVVFHGAGTASVGGSISTPLDDLRASVMTWANLLDSIRRSDCVPLTIFPSSAAVYGNPPHLPIAEDAPVAPISPYGFHKVACELLAREYSQCFGLDILVLRIFSVFGFAQRRLLVWEIFEQLNGKADSVVLKGTGEETRDYISIDELGSAFIGLATSHENREPDEKLRILNLASGAETRISELVDQMRRIIAPKKPIRYLGQSQPGNPARWQADCSALKLALPSWKPEPFTLALAKCLSGWSGIQTHELLAGNRLIRSDRF